MQKRDKLDSRARKSLLLGYKTRTKGYVLFYLHTHNIFTSTHVIFHENIFPYNNAPSNIVENIIIGVIDYVCFNDSFLTPKIHSSSLNNNILTVSSLTSDTNYVPGQFEEPILLAEPPLRKYNRLSKPPVYLQDFQCYNVTTNASYPLSNFLSYNNIYVAHLSYISTIIVNQESRTYK